MDMGINWGCWFMCGNRLRNWDIYPLDSKSGPTLTGPSIWQAFIATLWFKQNWAMGFSNWHIPFFLDITLKEPLLLHGYLSKKKNGDQLFPESLCGSIPYIYFFERCKVKYSTCFCCVFLLSSLVGCQHITPNSLLHFPINSVNERWSVCYSEKIYFLRKLSISSLLAVWGLTDSNVPLCPLRKPDLSMHPLMIITSREFLHHYCQPFSITGPATPELSTPFLMLALCLTTCRTKDMHRTQH